MKTPQEWAEECENGSGEYADLVLDVRNEFARVATAKITALAKATEDEGAAYGVRRALEIVETLAHNSSETPNGSPPTTRLVHENGTQLHEQLVRGSAGLVKCRRNGECRCISYCVDPEQAAACAHDETEQDLGSNDWRCCACGVVV